MQNFKTTFSLPQCPLATERCRDLICKLLREKQFRLSSRQYETPEDRYLPPEARLHYLRPHVFADDSEDIKRHPWFHGVPWDHLHEERTPFEPRVSGPTDTRHFDNSEQFGDCSESFPAKCITTDEARDLLRQHRPHVQEAAVKLVSAPQSSRGQRRLDGTIDANPYFTQTEKEALKHFTRVFGKRQRKKARDLLLRDAVTRDAVMQIRKATAFAGYTWHKIRPDENQWNQWKAKEGTQ